MLHLYLMFAIVALSSSIAYGVNQHRIIGGEKTTIEEHPYQVSIQKLNKNLIRNHICGGSLIKLDVVLTAAHCMQSSFQAYDVKAGSKYRIRGGLRIAVLYYVNHPKYDYETNDYDISLITLEEKFISSSTIKTIALLPAGIIIPDRTVATVTGWGRKDKSTMNSDILKEAQVIKYNPNLCTQLYRVLNSKITSRMTCYGRFGGGIDACQGDSGGPLVVGMYQVGIVSWGRDCAVPKQPGVYTNLEDWEIKQFISNLIKN